MMKFIFPSLAVLFILNQAFCSVSTPIELNTKYVLFSNSNETPIRKTLILFDDQKTLDFNHLLKLDQSQQLQWKTNESRNLGYSSSRIWIKFEVENSQNANSEWILEQRYPLLQSIDVYIQDGGKTVSFQTGRIFPFHQRPFQHRHLLYPFQLEKGKTAIVYAKVESKGPIQIILKVYNKNTFVSSSTSESIFLGIYLGAILAMIAYNVLLYIGTREKFYISYVLYAFFFFLFQTFTTGVAYQFLWPTFPKWNNIAGSFSLGASYFFLSRFTRLFLETKTYSPFSDWGLKIISWVSAGVMFCSVFFYCTALSMFNAVFITSVSFTLFIISLICLKAGSKNVTYFILAFGTFLVATACYGLNDLGKIPFNFLVLYGLLIASTAEVLLLSLALAARINLLKEENIQVQKNIVKKESDLAKEKSLAELASQVAHDVRSPLAALNMVIHDLSGLSEDNRLLVRSAIHRINDISNVLLTQHKKYQSTIQNAPMCGLAGSTPNGSASLLSGLIESIVSEKRTQFRLQIGITIESDFSDNSYGLFSEIDRIELERILSNLIDNSVESLDKEGHVRITLATQENMALIQISDTGRGIPNEILPSLGKKGVTYGKANGGGLGLYHAKTNIEAWNGKFYIDSILGQGTSVTLLLPKANPPHWFIPSLDLSNTTTWVIVDDDSSVHRIWQKRFDSIQWQQKGHQIYHFSHPQVLADWMKQASDLDSTRFLVDYEFINCNKTGLDTIRDLQISSKSTLVTSRFGDPLIQKSCEELQIKILPKGLIGTVPFHIPR